jgi:hypothetical protein
MIAMRLADPFAPSKKTWGIAFVWAIAIFVIKVEERTVIGLLGDRERIRREIHSTLLDRVPSSSALDITSRFDIGRDAIPCAIPVPLDREDKRGVFDRLPPMPTESGIKRSPPSLGAL